MNTQTMPKIDISVQTLTNKAIMLESVMPLCFVGAVFVGYMYFRVCYG